MEFIKGLKVDGLTPDFDAKEVSELMVETFA